MATGTSSVDARTVQPATTRESRGAKPGAGRFAATEDVTIQSAEIVEE